MTILEAMRDPKLFGATFAGESWTAWRAFLSAVFGLQMTSAQLEAYQRHTGRQTPPDAPAREAWLIVGRRGGKSRVIALLAVYLACFRDYATLLAPGEVGTLPIIAADRRQARSIMRYVQGLLEAVPMLRKRIASTTKETIELTNRVTIEIHTASFRTLRGYTIVSAVCDELAFWRSDEGAANPDSEILGALRPGMASVPGALLLCASSPYSRRGALWDAYRRHFGQDGDPVLVWQADSRSMNPTLSARTIADAYAADESAARAEYGAEFRSDLEAFVSRETLEACTIRGRSEVPPCTGITYVGFVDPSGGGGADSFTAAVAHLERGIAVLDAVREFRPPLSPAKVVAALAEFFRSYACHTVTGDRYAGEWPRERFAEFGIAYRPAEHTRSELYLQLLPLLTSGQVELLDAPRLHAQLASLERRTARSGRDTVDAPPRQHEDVANAAAGALVTSHRAHRAAVAVAPGGTTRRSPFHSFGAIESIGP